MVDDMAHILHFTSYLPHGLPHLPTIPPQNPTQKSHPRDPSPCPQAFAHPTPHQQGLRHTRLCVVIGHVPRPRSMHARQDHPGSLKLPFPGEAPGLPGPGREPTYGGVVVGVVGTGGCGTDRKVSFGVIYSLSHTSGRLNGRQMVMSVFRL